LPYLADLGINCIWLMPVNVSADKAHGYHVTDPLDIEPEYGDFGSLAQFTAAAHARGMHVIVDLVLNHASRRHPLFLASRDAASPFRDWFIWFDASRTHYGFGREFGGPRLTVDQGWGDLPDWNWSNPHVRSYLVRGAQNLVALGGVDGFRVDHVTGFPHSQFREVVSLIRKETKAWRDIVLVGEVFRGLNHGGGFGVLDYVADGLDGAFAFSMAPLFLEAAQV